MFSKRWKLLGEMMERCQYTTPDRSLSQAQCLQLFHAFLLQVKENKGMVCTLQSGDKGSLASYCADVLTYALQIPARCLSPIQHDFTLPLAILLKKTDLLIAVSHDDLSSDILGAVAITRGSDIPLITLTGGQLNSSSQRQGDLNIHFDMKDEALVKTNLMKIQEPFGSMKNSTSPITPSNSTVLPIALPES